MVVAQGARFRGILIFDQARASPHIPATVPQTLAVIGGETGKAAQEGAWILGQEMPAFGQ